MLFRVTLFLLILAHWSEAAAAPCGSRTAWVWSGLPAEEVARLDVAYVYQGNVVGEGFQRRGLSPYPAPVAEVVPVVRLIAVNGELPTAKHVAHVVEGIARAWEAHGKTITTVQLDYDSPTRRLDRYADLLVAIKGELGGRLRLSITGLADWVMSGSKGDLERLHAVADEVVIQLYDDRQAVTGFALVAARLLDLAPKAALGVLPDMKLPDEVCAAPALGRVVAFDLKRERGAKR